MVDSRRIPMTEREAAVVREKAVVKAAMEWFKWNPDGFSHFTTTAALRKACAALHRTRGRKG